MDEIKKTKTLIKYPGGKQNELGEILSRLPNKINRYFEPFLGGGALYFSLNGYKSFINDKSSELIKFYNYVSAGDAEFFKYLKLIQHNWDVMSEIIDKHNDEVASLYKSFKDNLIDELSLKNSIETFVISNKEEFNGMMDENFNKGIDNFIKEIKKSFFSKLRRMKRIELKLIEDEEKNEVTLNVSDNKDNNYKLLSDNDILKNIESAFKAAFYNHFRHLYNNIELYEITDEFATAIYFYIREYCFSSMFRYGPNGNFNVPYGGISYNRKSMDSKIKQMQKSSIVDKLKKTIIHNQDFEQFLKRYRFKDDDFIFIDPPYDTEFSTYAENTFGKKEHIRLAKYLKTKCNANFMMIIKKSDLIDELYIENELAANNRVIKIDKINVKYFVSFKNRNIKETTHLIITNY